jgi:hypothetical protein
LNPLLLLIDGPWQEGLIAVNCKRGKRKEKDEMK